MITLGSVPELGDRVRFGIYTGHIVSFHERFVLVRLKPNPRRLGPVPAFWGEFEVEGVSTSQSGNPVPVAA